MPKLSLFNLNILGKLGFGALGGFEYIAILAGETRAPASAVRKSVLIAAPAIALMFILGTATVVAYIPTNDIDLIGPMPQVLRAGFGPFGIAGPLVTIAILMTLAMRVAQVSVSYTAVTRLPMVAGWDRLLARLVFATASAVPDPGQLDRAGWRMFFRHLGAEPDRRRAAGGVPVDLQRRRHFLRIDIPGDVRDPDLRPAGCDAAAAALAAGGVVVGPADDAALRGAVRLSRSSM